MTQTKSVTSSLVQFAWRISYRIRDFRCVHFHGFSIYLGLQRTCSEILCGFYKLDFENLVFKSSRWLMKNDHVIISSNSGCLDSKTIHFGNSESSLGTSLYNSAKCKRNIKVRKLRWIDLLFSFHRRTFFNRAHFLLLNRQRVPYWFGFWVLATFLQLTSRLSTRVEQTVRGEYQVSSAVPSLSLIQMYCFPWWNHTGLMEWLVFDKNCFEIKCWKEFSWNIIIHYLTKTKTLLTSLG